MIDDLRYAFKKVDPPVDLDASYEDVSLPFLSPSAESLQAELIGLLFAQVVPLVKDTPEYAALQDNDEARKTAFEKFVKRQKVRLLLSLLSRLELTSFRAFCRRNELIVKLQKRRKLNAIVFELKDERKRGRTIWSTRWSVNEIEREDWDLVENLLVVQTCPTEEERNVRRERRVLGMMGMRRWIRENGRLRGVNLRRR